ncbi:MAG: CDP-2,3-bis-(O-geranylgeranyl)-sn-glycerol synthase [Nanoarchaeota archaeon]
MTETLFVLISQCFYLLLPAYFANMAPVIVKNVNFLNYPIDFGKKIGGKPILGNHKTFRGLFFGVLFGIIIAYFQFLIYKSGNFAGIAVVDYDKWLLLGILLGSGALIGDAVKSFFKRRVNIAPGAKFIPFDQTDFVIGALIFTMLFFEINLKIFFTSILLSFALHIITNHLAFWLKMRDEKW